MHRAIRADKCWVDVSGPHIAGFNEPSVRQKVLIFLLEASC